jgi:hypothetical protein
LRNAQVMFAAAAAAAGIIIVGAGHAAAHTTPTAATTRDTARTANDGDLPLDGPAVVVFQIEGSQANFHGTKLSIYRDPTGCYKLPVGAHVLDNLTTKDVTLYLDPGCLIPVPAPLDVLKPGYGAHVSPTGSFKVP